MTALLEASNEEEKLVRDALRTGKYDNIERKRKLKDIDYISIDAFGNPSIIFKSIRELETAIDYIDSICNAYTGAV